MNAITSGWSISFAVDPAGQCNRYALVSSRGAKITTWSTPALVA